MIFDRLRSAFQKKEPTKAPPMGEVGYETSVLYRGRDFAKYDPDKLKINKGAAVYKEMMRDDQVKPVMQFKILATLSRKWFFQVGTDDNGEKREDHQEMADYFTYMIEQAQGSFIDNLIGILSAMKHGFSVTEKIYQAIQWNGKTMWGLRDLKLRPFETFTSGFHVDVHGNIEKVIQKISGKEEPIPIEKIIHFVNDPDEDRHYGSSDLKAAYRPWWAKDMVIKFQGLYLERMAGGFPIANIKEGKSVVGPERAKLENLIQNASYNMGAIIPANVEFDLKQGIRTDAYEKAIAQFDKAIAKSLLVPNLLGIAEQGQTGSYSQSETQLKTFFWVLDAGAGRLEEVLNEQLFRDLAIWNFGTEDFPRFQFEPISEEMKELIAGMWGDLIQKGAVTHSDSDEAHLRDLLGFPAKEETEEDKEPLPEEEPELGDWIDALPPGAQELIRKELQEKSWLRRVDFARLENYWDSQDKVMSEDLADTMATVRRNIEDQIVKIAGNRSFGNVKPKEIEDVKIPKNLVTEIRNTLKRGLHKALDDSYAMARKELPRKIHAKLIQPGMDKTQAEKFLASKSMKIAGVIEQDVLKGTQQVLENAITYDKNLKQTIDSIRDNTTLVETLPEVDAAGRAINVPARLENITRTNTADAINRARSSLFAQPEFRGFIQAYEYSAILDSRTTDICEHLNGKILRDFSNYVPPNHYQCRSILVAVTIIDEWNGKESAKPRLEPQKGFG